MISLTSVTQFNMERGQETLHPLVSVLDQSKSQLIQAKRYLIRFEQLLHDYFQSDKPQSIGLPTVGYCAQQLHLSPNYFGDLVKKETGRSAQEYIRDRVIDLAKEKVFDTRKSISEIAYELGFKYPQHFTRFFKQQVGQTPNEYRLIN